jgi:hypothetical protein
LVAEPVRGEIGVEVLVEPCEVVAVEHLVEIKAH